ncbi:hypothetical protein KI387_015747, partial [Taxus chinensis]
MLEQWTVEVSAVHCFCSKVFWIKLCNTGAFFTYFLHVLIRKQILNYLWILFLEYAKARLTASELGGNPVLWETFTPTLIDNRTASVNCKTEMDRQSKSSRKLTPGSGTRVCSLRRSSRVSNRLSDTPIMPDNCVEVGYSSVMVTDNVQAGSLVDNVVGQESPVNKYNSTNSSRCTDKLSNRGQGRGRGKCKTSRTNAAIQEAHISGTGGGSRGGRGKGKRKLNPKTSREIKFSEDEESSDDESDKEDMAIAEGGTNNIVKGQESPVNKDNMTSSIGGKDNRSSRGQGRGMGRCKPSGMKADIQEAHTARTGRGNSSGRGKGKRKLNSETSREIKFSEDKSDEKETKSADNASDMEDMTNAEGGSNKNVKGQENPVNKDNMTSSSGGKDNGTSKGRGRGRGKRKSSSTHADFQEVHSAETGRGSRGGRVKGKKKLNHEASREIKFSEDASDEKEIKSYNNESDKEVMINAKGGSNNHVEIKNYSGQYSGEEISSTAECHVGDGILHIADPLDLVGEDVLQNVQQNQRQNHINGAADQDVMEVDAVPENHNQNYNNRVAELNGMEENAAHENHNQNHDNRDAEQNLMQDDDAPQNSNQNQSNRVSARHRFLEIARRRAAHFAFFDPKNEQPSTSQERPHPNSEGRSYEEIGDWPGPFSTARRLVEERAAALAARQKKLAESGKSASLIEWVPTREKDFSIQTVPPPLDELCLNVLCKHVEFIESLEGIPDTTKNKICRAFCASRMVTSQILRLFITGSQTEICVPDCSLVSEADLTELMAQCSTTNLEVLQLGMCGRGLTDGLLRATIACPSVGLPCLSRLSLNGAYRLSDAGLTTLVQAAPLLSSVELSRCSFLSEASINTLANHLAPVIRELRLEECHQLEASKILPALKKMHKLEVLSVAGIPSVTNEFVIEMIAYLCCNLKELSLADCGKLTNGAIEAIGAVCCGLNVLILDNLSLLTDTSLVYLTNGCRSLKTLSLKRCPFSDEAVAAFIFGSGNELYDLSLNSVKQVENHTILALVSNSSENLSRLDVSWCRKLTDEALGLLADSCPCLRELILFGCTQVTDKFLK